MSNVLYDLLDHLCDNQITPNSCDAFGECQTIFEAIELYLHNLKRERAEGIRLDTTEPDYFLEFIVPAECVKTMWIALGETPDEFKAAVDLVGGEIAELGNTLLENDFCSLAF